MWDRYAELGDTDRSTLSEQDQQLFAILDLRQEVNSGGFDSYFRYWGGNTAEVALKGLPRMLGEGWASLLREAMGLFGTAYPTDPDARFAAIDALGLEEALDALDQRLYDLEGAEDVDSRLEAFPK